MRKFVRHEDQIFVVLPGGTVSFSNEDELSKYVLEHLPLEVLLSSLQCRTAEFVGHKKATDRLKEIVDGVTAAGVVEMLTATPPPPMKDDLLNDPLDALRYCTLTQYSKYISSDKNDFGVVKINSIF